MLKQITTVIFDLDGTLLNTLEDLAASVNYALKTNGYPQRTTNEIRTFLGNGVKSLVKCSLGKNDSDEIFEKVFNCFRTYYMEHCQDTTRPFDGILPLLEELKKRKIKMAIVSNKLQPAVEQLNNHFFKKHISSAVGESATVRRKPNPDAVIAAMNALGSRKDETIYVGDSEIDIETAKNAGIDCIVVLWGFRDECFLRSQYHNIHYIHSPKELLYLLDTSI
ncbi:phosphoglycolate phosphatase [Bacteroidaceae bacterium]|uniref:HAD family hydrolase n=1 Tax=Prevotella sp. MGM2 TaxID=2033406 RepID=UPI000CE9E55E|nr:HAD family hydrolase [Prevotella sp. MGM2]GAY30309.1 phosphoglycolate phosphatase [Prevotella sp. MGM2]GFI33862.1 phosphoglycolate phosphatase [Bacteroidaceae bacterium]